MTACEQLAALVEHFARRAAQAEQALNAADARLGDGDTGSMLRGVTGVIAEVDLTSAADISEAAGMLARAAMAQTGSSLGTLVAAGLMTLSKEAKARGGDVGAADMGSVIEAVRRSLGARGGAASGDKTVLDSLEAVADAFRSGTASRRLAAEAAYAALDDLRDQPCRIGRARMFPERSKGSDDPGMLAVALLLSEEEGAK